MHMCVFVHYNTHTTLQTNTVCVCLCVGREGGVSKKRKNVRMLLLGRFIVLANGRHQALSPPRVSVKEHTPNEQDHPEHLSNVEYGTQRFAILVCEPYRRAEYDEQPPRRIANRVRQVRDALQRQHRQEDVQCRNERRPRDNVDETVECNRAVDAELDGIVGVEYVRVVGIGERRGEEVEDAGTFEN